MATRFYIELPYLSFFSAPTFLSRGHAVAQLVEALRYKSEGRGFDSGGAIGIFH
jgi:hypothetical protein